MSGLIAKGLTVSVKGRTILDGADIEVAPGEMVGLIGPNGAGKTTALRAILGLVPATVEQISIDGRDLRTLQPRERARLIAYLPQVRDVHWPITASTLVALGRFPHGGASTRGAAEIVAKSLAAVDAEELAARNVQTLSGGELARVLLARALAVEAPVLLADEPVAALDPGHQLAAMEHLASAARTSSVLVVMHDLSLAARFCSRLYLLKEGQVISSGPAAEVIASPVLESVFGVRILRAEAEGVPLVAPMAP